jgi:Putative Flp pilus-assembly TadE/G-like
MTMYYSKITTFAKDAKGAVLPTVAAVLVALMAFGTLAMDVSRYMDLQTQLQKAADSFALAAAAELDGQPATGGAGGAIARANAAVTALMAGHNSSVFNAAAVTAAVTFYQNLPATDNLAMGATTNDPTLANFVQVVVAPVRISTFFPATIFGAPSNNMTTSALAVAGFTQTLCGQPTPFYVCNGTPGSATDMLNQAAMIGHEVSLVEHPGQGQGGNYGFLDDLGCGGNTPCLENELGESNLPKSCAPTSNNIITTTGQKTAASEYFDTRFDLYQKAANKANKGANAAIFTPDANVRKGYKPGCNMSLGPPASELPFPDDSNVTPPYSTSVVGNGSWTGAANVNFNNYWNVNFPGTGVAKPAPTTRYAEYLYEIAKGLIPAKSKGNEVGTPQCNPANAQPDRRVLYAAVVNCGSLGGGRTKVTAQGIVKFFLLLPTIGTGGFGTMLAEYVSVVTPNQANGEVGVHDNVQLYR